MALSFGVSTFLKLGIGSGILLLSVDLLFIVYERQKKRLQQREIKEVCFLMSNRLPCCHHSNDVDSQLLNCKNDHCKGKLSNKIIQHIESANHLICIAMYMNSMNQITSAIMRAHKRGITIRIITDQSMIGSSNSKINELQRVGELLHNNNNNYNCFSIETLTNICIFVILQVLQFAYVAMARNTCIISSV